MDEWQWDVLRRVFEALGGYSLEGTEIVTIMDAIKPRF